MIQIVLRWRTAYQEIRKIIADFIDHRVLRANKMLNGIIIISYLILISRWIHQQPQSLFLLLKRMLKGILTLWAWDALSWLTASSSPSSRLNRKNSIVKVISRRKLQTPLFFRYHMFMAELKHHMEFLISSQLIPNLDAITQKPALWIVLYRQELLLKAIGYVEIVVH